jgi:uncharacterized OB-fold protein
MTYDKPVPDVTQPAAEPFWSGLREHRLSVQRCPECLALRYPAATICPECLHHGGEWTDISPYGTLWSYVVYHRDLSGSFADEIPYAIGVVELEEQLHVVARIDAPLNALGIGIAMAPRFENVTKDVTLLRWGLRVGEREENG